MANTKKSTTRTKKAAPSQRISNIIKPRGMSPREWQVTLRRQQAQKEAFAIREADSARAPGEYAVGNAKTRNEYRVSFYGKGHPLNSSGLPASAPASTWRQLRRGFPLPGAVTSASPKRASRGFIWTTVRSLVRGLSMGQTGENCVLSSRDCFSGTAV